MQNRLSKKTYFNIIAITVWLVIWQVVAMLIDNALILVSPIQSITALIKLLGSGSFLKSVFGSFNKILMGFLWAVLIAIILSFLSYKNKFIKHFITPPIVFFKTVPVASFAILLLISLKEKQSLSTVISFMICLPVIYENLLSGLNSLDNKMLEMADVFKVSAFKKFVYLYVYNLIPFFSTGSKIALGMCWKAGIAAELIALVQHTIGNELYYAKLYLMMDYVFAWTIVIIVISKIMEFAVLYLIKLIERRIEK